MSLAWSARFSRKSRTPRSCSSAGLLGRIGGGESSSCHGAHPLSVLLPCKPGAVQGDSYDNALAETIIGLFKAEVTHRRGP